MVDRLARNQLLAAIDDYLAGRFKTFEFDARMDDIQMRDETVRKIAHLVWFHYDDIINHPVRLSRQEWDYFQRLRLLLNSDWELRSLRSWHWGWDESFSLGSLMLLALIAWLSGFGFTLLGANFLVGIIFWINLKWGPLPRARPKEWTETFPFQSLGALRNVRESVKQFEKIHYPAWVENNCGIPLRSMAIQMPMILPSLLISPLFMLMKLLPLQTTIFVTPR